MLNKAEKSVMKVIYNKAKKKKGVCVVSDEVILESVPEKYELTQPQLHLMLKQMEYDGYFEMEKAHRKGQQVNVLTLQKKGEAFERELVQEKREVRRRLIIGLLVATATTIFTIILRQILT